VFVNKAPRHQIKRCPIINFFVELIKAVKKKGHEIEKRQPLYFRVIKVAFRAIPARVGA
jgi:hypothetical protein